MKLRLTLLTAATLTALSFSAHAVEKGTIMIMVNSLIILITPRKRKVPVKKPSNWDIKRPFFLMVKMSKTE